MISTFVVHPVGSLGGRVGLCKEWDANNRHRQAGWGIGVFGDGDFGPPVYAGRVASRRASVVLLAGFGRRLMEKRENHGRGDRKSGTGRDCGLPTRLERHSRR
ncbi:hypothetical protein CCUS01_10540 [Colletotrichum cuscutae]|uniref:Uncharacterized protein n=1 Tax=Colletotrichum cuscutae TaxID=1209917 RepID=A0AAI9U9I3_9PEZI|nr:hypothetical protein CCUS01_10540 [Colletotrichum cuscutae]